MVATVGATVTSLPKKIASATWTGPLMMLAFPVGTLRPLRLTLPVNVLSATVSTVTEAFTPVYEILIKAILDPTQDVSVKLVATNGVIRILKIGTPNVNERTKIAEAVISELVAVKTANRPTDQWYELRLVGALGSAALDQLKSNLLAALQMIG